MNRIDKLIDNFVKDYTVPANTTISKSVCNIYGTEWNPETGKREISIDFKKFDELTKCKFLVYNGKRLIQKIYKNRPHYFTFYENYDAPPFRRLIDRILDIRLKRDYDDVEGVVPIDKAQEAIKHFGLDTNLDDYSCHIEGDNIIFSGDHWDYSWDESYMESTLYQKINKKLKEILQVEIASYRKYNPNFNIWNNLDQLTDPDKIIDRLTLEELFKVFTTSIYEEDLDSDCTTLCTRFELNESELLKLDKGSLKQVLSIVLSDNRKSHFVWTANELYNL